MSIATPTESGSYEYKFVNPVPDRCICKICQYPSRDAYMTGHCCKGLTVCKSCLDQHQITTDNFIKCPVCRKEEGGFHPNYPIKREINNLHIYCTNKEKGCEWQRELNNINNHLGNSVGCQFEEVKCSNECGKMIERRYLTSHVETECPRRKCQYCHDTVEHQFIEGQHKEECPKLPLPCPNKCEVGSVPREDMETHRKECPFEMIQCEYYSVGCKVRMVRKDQEKHDDEKVKEHLMMTNHELTDTKAQLAIASKQINQLQLAMVKSMSISLINANRSIILDVKATMSLSGNQICPVTIKMSKFNSRKERKKGWLSDPFYTHNKGYKMRLNVDAAGYDDGEGTHLSVYLYLMKGPHDDKLTWPLRGSFEIKLLNQISDSEHCPVILKYDDEDAVGRVTENENSLGYDQYISNQDLNKDTQTCQYLKDDCLFFQVTKLEA